MAKVLFVDDEPDVELLTKQKFRKQIASGVFDVLFAQNGQEALNFIEKEPDIAVVVSDINMPQMDGLTLLDKLNECSPATKTIVVSAYGDTKTLRAAMNKGVFDFVTKPVDFNELGETILRTLALYKPPSTPLADYQHLLEKAFPPQVTLDSPRGKKAVLWDAFLFNSQQLVVLGVSSLSSAIPLEIALSTAHGVLKVSLQKSLDFPLRTFEETLGHISLFLKADVFIGKYDKNAHMFSYEAQGEFNVCCGQKGGEEKTVLSSHPIPLVSRDVITCKTPLSTSQLLLTA